eukprot:TRINITY_DN18663_c0_g1_i1.p1 TRINITY_DN18663_c0_g1~~TRINITY_DN18663_c0_g1_i1.p1  ORF type:complete len:199 (+),score=15.67 TRINITY_DN18663_c0_g1_i1:57-653(+)
MMDDPDRLHALHDEARNLSRGIAEMRERLAAVCSALTQPPEPIRSTIAALANEIAELEARLSTSLDSLVRHRANLPASTRQLILLVDNRQFIYRGSSAADACTICAICQGELKHRDMVLGMPCCSGLLHRSCAMPWFNGQNSKCPLCRQCLPDPPERPSENDPSAGSASSSIVPSCSSNISPQPAVRRRIVGKRPSPY